MTDFGKVMEMAGKGPLSDWLRRRTAAGRNRCRQKKQKRLQNKTPTIIGNNCVCGAIYRDLDLPYLSPTVNVLIQAEDFFRFVRNPEAYLSCVPEEITLEGVSCPAGVLRHAGEQVIVRFFHDTSFEEAKEKWMRRCARVDPGNLYIIYEMSLSRRRLYLPRTNKWYRAFKALPYPNKRMLVNTWFSFDKEVVPLRRGFLRNRGTVLEYPTRYSKKRPVDQFDYVSFLNQE